MLLVEDKIVKIINELDIPNEVGTYEGEDCCPFVERLSYKIYEQYKGKACNGISKAAIVLPDSKCVIKIPFNGAFYTQEEYNADTDEYEYTDEEFIPFEYADDLNLAKRKWDYCENEFLKYQIAVKDGFGEFLAETEFYGYKDGHPIYLQEKVVSYREDSKSRTPSDEAKKKYKSFDKFHYFTNSIWTSLAIDWYGEEKVAAFIEYCDNNLTGDLHDGNIGFAENGRPVLLDWADWRD